MQRMDEKADAPVAGWYTDESGKKRWWDGEAWGPYAPSSEPARGALASIVIGAVLLLAAILSFFYSAYIWGPYGLIAVALLLGMGTWFVVAGVRGYRH